MESTGKVIAVLPTKTGTSQRGKWTSQEFVIETHEQYPKKQCFNIFGEDKINLHNIAVGQEIKVSFEYESREANGRWFSSGRVFAVEHLAGQTGQQPSVPQSGNDNLAF